MATTSEFFPSTTSPGWHIVAGRRGELIGYAILTAGRWEALDPDGKRKRVASKGQARDWLLLRRSTAWLREGIRLV